MKTRFWKGCLGLLCLAVVAGAMAAGEAGPSSSGSMAGHTVGGDHYAAGRMLTLNQAVVGDLMAAGGQVSNGSSVGGSALLAGGQVQVSGPVAGNLYLGGGQVTLAGRVGHNARVAGGRIEFTAPSDVSGNLSVGGGEVVLKGRVGGYVMAGAGRLLIDGEVAGDVDARADEIALGPNARIGGRLLYASRAGLVRDPAAQVRGEVRRLDGPADWPPQDEPAMLTGSGWLWTLGLLVVAAVLVAALPNWSKGVSVTWRERFLSDLLLGFVLLVSVPAAAVLLLVTVVGIPLGLMTLAAYPVLLLTGYVVSGVALGLWGAQRYRSGWVDRAGGRIAAAVLGMLVLCLLTRIPWLGGMVLFLALLAGLGALGFQTYRAR